ncbi:hypothetical protein [Qipengyuania sp. MTN3-11]|uniref:hypothetical protein n=1 Tax=Qipengyuania sp. MTN3-11 TaxID=3056557 RepID=UPI0036F22AE8
MSSWAIVAIIAIVVWGIVQSASARSRSQRNVIVDEDGNETFVGKPDEDARREIAELRERIKVLERIATESNSLDAQERKRIEREIDALREQQD